MGNQIPGSPRNIRLKNSQRPEKAFFFGLLLFLLFGLGGCGPKYTYPADSVPRSIESICKKEYKMDVHASVNGKTVGAVIYLDAIIDAKGQIPKEVNETMGKVMQVVTRVALSTDRELDFCTVVLRDKTHASELVISRALDDTKRANADAIGIEESINRTLFGQEKYQLPDTATESFVVKEITKEKFLAEQIVQRIRFNFSKDSKSEIEQPLVLADGAYEEKEGKKGFYFSIIALKADEPRQLMLRIFKIVNDVLKGYQFTLFDIVEIHDYLNRQKLVIDRQTILDYQNKKIKEEDLLDKFLFESQSIQEAFKLFGFNVPQESGDTETPLPATASP